jgi:hypothetical protein
MATNPHATQSRLQATWQSELANVLGVPLSRFMTGLPEDRRHYLDLLLEMDGFVSMILDDEVDDQRLGSRALLFESEVTGSPQLVREARESYFRTNRFRVPASSLGELLVHREIDPRDHLTYLSIRLDQDPLSNAVTPLPTILSCLNACSYLTTAVLELYGQDSAHRAHVQQELEGAQSELQRLDEKLPRGLWLLQEWSWDAMGRCTRRGLVPLPGGKQHHPHLRTEVEQDWNENLEEEAGSFREWLAQQEGDKDWF